MKLILPILFLVMFALGAGTTLVLKSAPERVEAPSKRDMSTDGQKMKSLQTELDRAKSDLRTEQNLRETWERRYNDLAVSSGLEDLKKENTRLKSELEIFKNKADEDLLRKDPKKYLQEKGLLKAGGFLVTGVTRNSTAQEAGVQIGDIITKYDGTTIEDEDDLYLARQKTSITDKITLHFMRGGEMQELTMKGGPIGVDGEAVRAEE